MLKQRTVLRVFSILMIASLLLSACAAPAPASPTAAPTSGPGEPGAENPEEHEPVTLVYWHGGANPPLKPAMDELVAQFMAKYPWITVKVESFPFGEYFQKIDTATAGKTAPDVLWVDPLRTARDVAFDVLRPLDEFVPADYRDDWFPIPLDEMQYQDQIWAIPLHQSTDAIVYNKEIIDAAGLEPPTSYDESWTLDEFVDALKQVTTKGPDGKTQVWAFCQQRTGQLYSLQPWLAAFGASLTDPEGTVYSGYTNSDEAVQGFEWYAQLHKDGLMPIEAIPNIFETGNVAFYQTNPYALVDIQQRFPDLEVGVMPMPCGVQCAVPSGGWHIGMHAQTEHPEEAWLLIDFLTNTEGHQKWIELSGYMPARISTYEAMPKMKEYPWSIFMEGLAKYPVRRPRDGSFTVYMDEFVAAIKNVLTGADPRAELDRVAALGDEEMQKFK